MLEQELSEKSIRKLIRKKDIIKYQLLNDDIDVDDVIESLAKRISSRSYEFEFNSFMLFNKKIYTPANIETELILRNVDYLTRRIYKIRQANRDNIIKQIASILKSSNHYEITKLDISKYYETINVKRIIEKLSTDSILSNDVISTIIQAVSLTSIDCLPRGLAISASFSELFMRDLDKYIRSLPGIIYIARYVDDIIIISMPNQKDKIHDIKLKIAEKGLSINTIKERCVKTTDLRRNDHFSYLGYNFKIYNTNNRLTPRKLELSIAPDKIEKIKRKYCIALAAYLKDDDFNLLVARIKVLTSNYNLSVTANGYLKSGIYYSYKLIDLNSKSLYLLDRFRRKILRNNGRLSIAVNTKLSSSRNNLLNKYSFRAGFTKSLALKYSSERLIQIHKCWQNV